MKKTYNNPVSFHYDGVRVSKREAVYLMKEAGCDNHVCRCTQWELLNENAMKGDERAKELLRHLVRIDERVED